MAGSNTGLIGRRITVPLIYAGKGVCAFHKKLEKQYG